MTRRRALILVAAILLGIAALFFLRRSRPPETTVARSSGPVPAALPPGKLPPSASAPVVAAGSGDAPSPIADALNIPGGTIRRDLEIVSEVFVAWQSNFPTTGNPVGENAEITAALLGANPLKFAFIRPGHRALNGAGELCDRWGTPFRFHQLSGLQMEIRSAGPDKKFATADDASWP
jgi:hypothetical protein